jgi:hypothetical protein
MPSSLNNHVFSSLISERRHYQIENKKDEGKNQEGMKLRTKILLQVTTNQLCGQRTHIFDEFQLFLRELGIKKCA